MKGHQMDLIEYVGGTDDDVKGPGEALPKGRPDWAMMSTMEIVDYVDEMDRQFPKDPFFPCPHSMPKALGGDLPHIEKQQGLSDKPKVKSRRTQEAAATQCKSTAPDKPKSSMDATWQKFTQFAQSLQKAPWRNLPESLPPAPKDKGSLKLPREYPLGAQQSANEYDPITQEILKLRDTKLSGTTQITSSNNMNAAQQNHEDAAPSVPHPQFEPPPRAEPQHSPSVPHPQNPPQLKAVQHNEFLDADDVHEILMNGCRSSRSSTPASSSSKGKPSKWGQGKRSQEGARRRPRGGKDNGNTQWLSALHYARKKGPETYFRFQYLYPKPAPQQELENWTRWRKWFDEQAAWPTDTMFQNQQWQMLLPPAWREKEFQHCVTFNSFFAVTLNKPEYAELGGFGEKYQWWDGQCWCHEHVQEGEHPHRYWNRSSWQKDLKYDSEGPSSSWVADSWNPDVWQQDESQHDEEAHGR
jgi:hypothetical protein